LIHLSSSNDPNIGVERVVKTTPLTAALIRKIERRNTMEKKDIVFLATTIATSPFFSGRPVPTNEKNLKLDRDIFMDWHRFLSERYEECQGNFEK
jgi:hypothetical protein